MRQMIHSWKCVGLGIVQFLLAASVVTGAELDETLQALERWKAKIAEAESLPPEQAIPILGEGVRKLSKKEIYDTDERLPVHAEAQRVILGIPGHAEYYANRIKEARKNVEAAPPNKKASLWTALQNEQMYGFQTLGQLPSPETIRVLGDFLSDEQGRSRTKEELEIARERGESSNAEWSLHTLAGMPLTYKPVQPRPLDATNFESDINAWRLWYEQIKAGTRTFRFEGDSQEYSLTGPVSEAREPKTVDRVPHSNQTPASTVDTEKKTTGLQIWPLTLAGILLAVAGWFAMKRKPTES